MRKQPSVRSLTANKSGDVGVGLLGFVRLHFIIQISVKKKEKLSAFFFIFKTNLENV